MGASRSLKSSRNPSATINTSLIAVPNRVSFRSSWKTQVNWVLRTLNHALNTSFQLWKKSIKITTRTCGYGKRPKHLTRALVLVPVRIAQLQRGFSSCESQILRHPILLPNHTASKLIQNLVLSRGQSKPILYVAEIARNKWKIFYATSVIKAKNEGAPSQKKIQNSESSTNTSKRR